MVIELVAWSDHYSEYGWFAEVKPEGHTNLSSGFLVYEDETYISLAQTMHKDETMYADLIHILKVDILTRNKLCEF